MTKKTWLAALLLGVAGCAAAQTNIQEMYDFNRGHFTTTLEMFQGDKWGSTFFFTDIYHPNDIAFPTDYYTEIARSFNFWQGSKLAPMSLHLEWNGGLGNGYGVANAWLAGVEWFMHNADFSNTFTFELLYKNIIGQTENIPLQFTFVWGMQNLCGVKGLVFSGFLDIWGEKNVWGMNSDGTLDETGLVLLSEPQLWYNIGQHLGCSNLYVGGEVELAYNFSGAYPVTWHDRKGFSVAPCLGLKWIFNPAH